MKEWKRKLLEEQNRKKIEIVEDPIPVIIIQYSSHQHTKELYLAAKKHNDRVILITSKSDLEQLDKSIFTEVYAIESYPNLSTFFRNIYKHMSTNAELNELFNFKRIMVLCEFMKEHDIENVFYMDNCVLLNKNISKLGLDIDKTYYCIPDNTKKPYRWSASLHSAFVNIDFLDQFVSMCFEYYQNESKLKILQEKYNFHKETNQDGGICDMTLLYLYSKENEVVNLLDSGFDHTLTSDESSKSNYYRIKDDIKDIVVSDGKVMVKTFTDDYTEMNTLNFQGNALKYFPSVYSKLTDTESHDHQ